MRRAQSNDKGSAMDRPQSIRALVTRANDLTCNTYG